MLLLYKYNYIIYFQLIVVAMLIFQVICTAKQHKHNFSPPIGVGVCVFALIQYNWNITYWKAYSRQIDLSIDCIYA